jgi:hypothetical protein
MERVVIEAESGTVVYVRAMEVSMGVIEVV